MVWRYKQQYRTKQWHWDNLNYASERGAIELGKFCHFHILKLLFPSIFCWYFWWLYLRSTFSGLKVHLHIHTINAVGYYLWYGVVYERQYTDITLTLLNSMYMRSNGASELRKCSHFYMLKLLFLSIFVGTSDTLSLQMTCLSSYM